jgi:hypothetical protein
MDNLTRIIERDRPTFYFNGSNTNKIRAGGGIFYKTDLDGNVSFLLMNVGNKYEDFGGKTDIKDLTINETIAREVDEESNSIFKKNDIVARIKGLIPIYTNVSKYLLYFIKLTNEEANINPLVFGTKEIHDDIDRIVEFIPLHTLKTENFIKYSLANRLKFRAFFKYINDLEKIEHNNAIINSNSNSNTNINDLAIQIGKINLSNNNN